MGTVPPGITGKQWWLVKIVSCFENRGMLLTVSAKSTFNPPVRRKWRRKNLLLTNSSVSCCKSECSYPRENSKLFSLQVVNYFHYQRVVPTLNSNGWGIVKSTSSDGFYTSDKRKREVVNIKLKIQCQLQILQERPSSNLSPKSDQRSLVIIWWGKLSRFIFKRKTPLLFFNKRKSLAFLLFCTRAHTHTSWSKDTDSHYEELQHKSVF